MRLRRPFLIKTHAAQDRPVFARHEGHNCVVPALRADDGAFRAHALISSFSFAALAALGIMLELLLAEEMLLAGAEDKRLSAINACQDSVSKLHAHLMTLLDCELRARTSSLELHNVLQKRALEFQQARICQVDFQRNPVRCSTVARRMLIRRMLEKSFIAMLLVHWLRCTEVLRLVAIQPPAPLAAFGEAD